MRTRVKGERRDEIRDTDTQDWALREADHTEWRIGDIKIYN